MYRGMFDTVDYGLQDKLMQQEQGVDTRIAIISMDDQSLEDMGSWPWNTELIRLLTEGDDVCGERLCGEISISPTCL